MWKRFIFVNTKSKNHYQDIHCNMKRAGLRGIIALLITIGCFLNQRHISFTTPTTIHSSVKEVQLGQYVVETKPDSFFFIHCPKTGTSLFTVLRNSLDSCLHKDFTCFGVFGGGYWGTQLKHGKSVYPFDARVMFPNNTTNEINDINTCNGSLPNCASRPCYHCPYNRYGHKKNKVTMFRDPYKWLPSYANWMWPELASKGKSLESLLPFQSQISFTTGTTNVTTAINILQNDYVWWGISDHWEVSLCTFHCKFGGNISDSELQNTRLGHNVSVKTLDDIKVKVPPVEDIIPNFTEYVDYHYFSDVLFYSELLSLFWVQADLCGCKA